MNTFVRKDFYVQPPTKTATKEEWQQWIKADSFKARAAKAQYTKNQARETIELPETVTRKVNGKWVQTGLIGFIGEGEDKYSLEPIQEETQTQTVERKQKSKLRGRNRKGKQQRMKESR